MPMEPDLREVLGPEYDLFWIALLGVLFGVG